MHPQEFSSLSRRQTLLASIGLLAGSLSAPVLAAQSPKKVLLVVRMEGKSLPIDQKIQQHLVARGYAVTLHSQYAPVEAALDADLVILSSTIRSHDLLGAYRHVPVPLLTWENDLLDDLAMTGKRAGSDFGSVEKNRYVWLVNAPHPMAAGLPAGVVDVYAKQATMSWGKPGLGATVIATLHGEPEKAAIFGYEKGATMDYESLAPARRVMFFLDNETFPNLSEAGLQLFDAAVAWAIRAQVVRRRRGVGHPSAMTARTHRFFLLQANRFSMPSFLHLFSPVVPGLPRTCLCLTLAAIPAFAFSQTAGTAGTPAQQTAGSAPTAELETIQIRAEKQPDNANSFVAQSATGVLRSDAPLFETAQSISVVTQQQIEEKQLKTVAEALEGVAGVSSGSYGRRGWDDFIIRGQISSAQTYLDGLRTQTSTNVLRSEDIFGIGSIEVVKGPTSVGFGLALPGGLVNLTTKRPQAESFARSSVSYGSYGLKEANFDLNYAPDGSRKGALRIVGRASDQQDPTDYVYFKNQYLATSYNFDLDGRNDLSVIASYQHRDYIRNQGIPQNYQNYGRKVFIGEPDRSYKVDAYRLGANYAHYFDNEWVFKQNFAVSKGSSFSDSVFAAANAKFPLVTRQINYQDKQDTNIALDSYLQRQFKLARVGYELTAGVDMMQERSDYYQRVDNINAFNASNPVYGVTSIKEGKPSHNLTYNQYVGLYLRNTLKIDEKWIVGLSGRHDWTRVEVQNMLTGGSLRNNNTAFTGSASLMYQVNDFIAPYVSYSTSFMPVTDTGINGSLLSPEEGKQTELGVKFQALDRRVQGYVAVYDLQRKNVTESDATLGYSVQTGEQTTKGFEAEITAAVTRQWNVSAAYSYIPTARISQSLTASEIGKRINHVPRNAGTLFTQYYFQPDRLGWNMGAGLRLQGERTAQRGTYFVNLPKYTLFDLNLGYEEQSWGMNLAIKNLLDKGYIQGTTPNAQLISFGSPRTLVLTAKFKY